MKKLGECLRECCRRANQKDPSPPPDTANDSTTRRRLDYEHLAQKSRTVAAALLGQVALLNAIPDKKAGWLLLGFVVVFMVSIAGIATALGRGNSQAHLLKWLRAEGKIRSKQTMNEAAATDKGLMAKWPSRCEYGVAVGVYGCIVSALFLVAIAVCAVTASQARCCAPPPVATATPTATPTPTSSTAATSTPTQTHTPSASPTNPGPVGEATPTPAPICKATVYEWGHVVLRSWPADPEIEVHQPQLVR